MGNSKDQLIEIDPIEDERCPEHTKKYLLEKGYKPYRKENGKITWVNQSNRIYKSIRHHHKSLLFKADRFGQKRLRTWVRVLLYSIFILTMLYILLHSYIRLPMF